MIPRHTHARSIKLSMSIKVTGKLPTRSPQARQGGLKRLHAALERLEPNIDKSKVLVSDSHEVDAQAYVDLTGQPHQITQAIWRFRKKSKKDRAGPSSNATGEPVC